MRRHSAARALVAIWLLAPCVDAACLEVVVAPIAYQDAAAEEPAQQRRPAQDLLRRLSMLETGWSVNVRSIDDSRPAPLSFMEAALLCESEGCPYLLYGFVRRTEFTYYGEIKLLSRDGKDVTAAFVGADDITHYERLMDDLAGKISTFVQVDLGMGPSRAPPGPRRNILVLPVSAGYWTPAGGGWNAVMAGLGCVEAGVRFVPVSPLFRIMTRPGSIALGLDAEYGLAVNQRGLEPFFLHAVKIRLPVEAFLELSGGHTIGAGIGPLLEIDTMVQSRLYGSTVSMAAVAPGASFSLTYKYGASRNVAIGVVNILDVAFYSHPFVAWSPRLFADFSLSAGSQEEK